MKKKNRFWENADDQEGQYFKLGYHVLTHLDRAGSLVSTSHYTMQRRDDVLDSLTSTPQRGWTHERRLRESTQMLTNGRVAWELWLLTFHRPIELILYLGWRRVHGFSFLWVCMVWGKFEVKSKKHSLSLAPHSKSTFSPVIGPVDWEMHFAFPWNQMRLWTS